MPAETLVDFHIHAEGGLDSRTPISEVFDHALSLGLGIISITNHDKTADPKKIESASLETGVISLTGCEFTARAKSDGFFPYHFPHILVLNAPINEIKAFYKDHSLPFKMSTLKEVLAWAHDLPNTLVIAAHPSPTGNIISLTFDEISQYRDSIDAIEVLNGYGEVKSNGMPRNAGVINLYNRRVDLAEKTGLSVVANSDAHRKIHIGRASTIVYENPRTPNDTVEAIKTGACRPVCRGFNEAIFNESGVIYSSSSL
jgi:histidinol phosphatase-like PHP family hydrolase